MNLRALPLASLLACVTLAACSDNGETTMSSSSAGGGGSSSSTTTTTTTTTTGSAGAGGNGSTGVGGSGGGAVVNETPIDAVKEQWAWVPFEGASCANGTATGIGVNLTDKSKRVLIYLEGGGACWDELTCYGLKTAVNLDGYGEAKFATDVPTLESVAFFNRADPKNPFKDYSFVFVPYCTGDIHAGSNTITYGTTQTMHVGFTNMGLFLKRIVPTFPDAERVFLAGSSAGGFGSLANWWRTQEAFGKSRVDLIDDSGTPLPSSYGNQTFKANQRANWNLDAAAPPGCVECKDDIIKLVGFYGRTFPDHRGALLSFSQDNVLAKFAQITTAEFQMGLEEMTKSEIDPNPSLHYFIASGVSHVLWTSPLLATQGVTLQDWFTQMVSDDPAWTSEHP